LFSSSKKKADLPPEREWYITDATTIHDTDYPTYNNVRYIIQQMERNQKELTEKIDKILTQNQELQERCEALENEVGIKKR